MKKFFVDNNIPEHQPNIKNLHGVHLNDFSFQNFFKYLIAKVITPIAKKLWDGVGEDSLDHYNAFTTAYSLSQDKIL